MNKTLYTCIDKYNFNFSKMITDTKLKFSGEYLLFNKLSNGISFVYVA